MAAKDPVSTDAVELTGDLADDGTRHSDNGGCPPTVYLTCLTDDNTTSSCLKPGKGGVDGDALRVEYTDLAGVAVNDTISFVLRNIHQIDDGVEIQAYTDSNSVTATAKLVNSAPIGVNSTQTFTLTQAFIDELGDVGGGNFAVRFQPQAQEAGDVQVAEVDADLTEAAGGLSIPVAMASFRRRHEMKM